LKARGGPGIAVIVSTYERPDALDAVLQRYVTAGSGGAG